jgi:hypothetical protein
MPIDSITRQVITQHVTAAYTAQLADTQIVCDATSSGFIVTLYGDDSGAYHRLVVAIDPGDSSGNTVTITDGTFSTSLDTAESSVELEMQYDGTWMIAGQYPTTSALTAASEATSAGLAAAIALSAATSGTTVATSEATSAGSKATIALSSATSGTTLATSEATSGGLAAAAALSAAVSGQTVVTSEATSAGAAGAVALSTATSAGKAASVAQSVAIS